MHMTSRQRARPFHQPGKLVVGVVLDLACKAMALWVLASLAVFVFRLERLSDWSEGDRFWGAMAGVGMVGYVVLAGVRYHHGRHTLCPLCRGPVFHVQRSVKSRGATKIPGLDYRTSIVLSLFLVGRYRCMYCGTPFRLKR
jgi:hypothetical protein